MTYVPKYTEFGLFNLEKNQDSLFGIWILVFIDKLFIYLII